MKPELAYPLKGQITVNQVFGANKAYYEATFGQDGHPGIDLAATHGTPVYAAHDGQAIYLKDKYGGEGIWLYNGSYITIYWHLVGDTDPKFPTPIPYNNYGIRTAVKQGELIGYAGNTGAPYESTGDHLHFGLMLAENDIPINTNNGTQGCINPQPYFIETPTQIVAQQAAEVATDTANINPGSPTAPQQESLVEEVVNKIEKEIEQL